MVDRDLNIDWGCSEIGIYNLYQLVFCGVLTFQQAKSRIVSLIRLPHLLTIYVRQIF